ncbi:hypothetical protein ACEPAF_1086 [Sanghuangporus sanghuang]
MRCSIPPQQAAHPFVPPAQDHRDATGVTYGGLGQPMDAMMNQACHTHACYKCGQVGHYIRECPRGREAICAIIAAFVPEDREALLEELGQAKESSFEEVEILTDVLPDESEDDDDDFKVYEVLFVRRTDAQAGELREEERNQTAIKNEVVAEAPYRENVVAQANITEAVWDVVGRCAAEVWHEGIVDVDQFVRRAGGKELDAFVSIVHPKVAGDDEVDLLNPLLEEENFINAHALIDSGCTGSCIDEGFVKRYGFPTQRYIRPRPVFNADGTSNEAGLIKKYVVVQMFFGKHEEEIRLAVTSLASSNIFLRHDWLTKHNPEIDWRLGTVKFTHCPDECESSLSSKEIDKEFVRNVRMKEAAKWLPYLEEYADVFSEESFERLPNH